ncbi:MAG: PorT family protein [Cyclobacteriaceae bacterium]|nr:hypothetical protein [Cyclobacteriaceae bacterium]MCH8515804.1 PorT family protein [Cyclobacteriaceae bacterium]
MKNIILFILFISVSWSAIAQDNCERALIDAENKYRSGELYDIPDILMNCVDELQTTQEKQRAYRLLVLTYLNINKEDDAKQAMLAMLRLNPDVEINTENSPVELIELYRQYRTEPIHYFGFYAGGSFASPSFYRSFSASPTGERSAKSYLPLAGFHAGFSFTQPLSKSFFLTLAPSFVLSRYGFDLDINTDAFDVLSPVQSVIGQERIAAARFPLLLDYKVRKSRFLSYHFGIGAGVSWNLSSEFRQLERTNRRVFAETITASGISSTSYRQMIMPFAMAQFTVEYKFAGIYYGFYAHLQHDLQQFQHFERPSDRFINSMNMMEDFGFIDDDFFLANLHLGVYLRKPVYKFLKK